MQIKDLQARQGKVDIVLDVIDVSEPRTFEKFGKQGRVANAVAKDESGDIKLTLWNEDIDKVKAGDKVKITNGYVSEWQGELQLGTGKYGQMEIIGDSPQVQAEETAPSDEAANKEMYQEEMAKVDAKEEELMGEKPLPPAPAEEPAAEPQPEPSEPKPQDDLEGAVEEEIVEEEVVGEEKPKEQQ